MKFSTISFIAVLCLFLSACEKSEWDKDKEAYDKEEKECFGLIYPVTYIMPDGSSISGGEEDIEDAIKAWYEANPDSEEKPELQYPVEVIFEKEDIVKEIANEEEMILVKKACFEEDKEICFQFVFPMTYLMPDGTSLSGENEEGL